MLILGGTFDPPHIGHLVLAEHARVELGEERVVLLPAGDPWRKSVPATTAGRRAPSPARIRLAMTRIAARDGNRALGAPRFEVDDREVRRKGPSYTADTLAEYHAEGHEAPTLLLGSDALADLPHWHEPARIVELGRIAVTPKPGETGVDEALAALEQALPGAASRIVVLETIPPLEVSSTQVRERIAAGLPVSFLLTRSVAAFISHRSLYRPE
jgi:nicotinate-nucleotide adenylyltransferase